MNQFCWEEDTCFAIHRVEVAEIFPFDLFPDQQGILRAGGPELEDEVTMLSAIMQAQRTPGIPHEAVGEGSQ